MNKDELLGASVDSKSPSASSRMSHQARYSTHNKSQNLKVQLQNYKRRDHLAGLIEEEEDNDTHDNEPDDQVKITDRQEEMRDRNMLIKDGAESLPMPLRPKVVGRAEVRGSYES